MNDIAAVSRSLSSLLRELINGPRPDQFTWVLNPNPESGLIPSLQRLSSAEASVKPRLDRACIAAHVHHIRYSLQLLNRWAQGENAYQDADWEQSWQVESVTEEEWSQLIEGLRHEADKWIQQVHLRRDWDADSMTGAIASAAHVAYHLGSIRQMLGTGS
ncbi:hypothetical protein [Cohnella hongkongensis]|uniref:DinB-like domain-containing protein n=1 Tax=Cohnella hongkongensis TaxID=178337 RepID=A0ABV9FBC9_9BACL